jgi:hypothetical protein
MFDGARSLFLLPIYDAFKAGVSTPNAHFCRMTLVHAQSPKPLVFPPLFVLFYPRAVL